MHRGLLEVLSGWLRHLCRWLDSDDRGLNISRLLSVIVDEAGRPLNLWVLTAHHSEGVHLVILTKPRAGHVSSRRTGRGRGDRRHGAHRACARGDDYPVLPDHCKESEYGADHVAQWGE